MSLEALINSIETNREEFRENLIGVIVETRSSAVTPEHLLAALLQVKNSFGRRRLRRQKVEPEHAIEFLKSCVEDMSSKVAKIYELEGAPLNDEIEAIINEIENHSGEGGEERLAEGAFIALLASKLKRDTIEGFLKYAFVNWDEFIKNLSWPPIKQELGIRLWHPKTSALMVEKAFDKTGRKLLSIFSSEVTGLGMRKYTVEALFIALVSIEPSVLDLAIRTQMIGSNAGFSNTTDLVLELRNRIRRPRNVSLTEEIYKNECNDRLISIVERAAELAGMDTRKRISARDIAESFVICEANGRFGEMIKIFGVDLEKASEFIESYQEEIVEEEDTLVAYDQLEQKIKEEIIGQDHAVKRILPLIKRLRFGYRRPGKPAGVFLFMGPSGTGKTHMAKELARILYGSSDSLLMLEMGQYGTKESKSMFIGASPGYVGYGEGKLTNGLRDKPESVILFDEVEKADPLVFDVLLRFLDEGQIDDPAGPVRNGNKCLIILTSNFLADELYRFEKNLQNTDERAQEKLYRDLRNELLNQGKIGGDEKIRKFFRPEFVFRIDEIILFRSFDLDDYVRIAEIAVKNEIMYIRKHFEYNVTYSDAILKKIADECLFRKNEGARIVNRLVNVLVVNPLIDYFSGRSAEATSELHLSMDEDGESIIIRERS